MNWLAGRRALITGIASKRSIAWGIAQAMKQQGAELAFFFQNDRLEKRVKAMAQELDSHLCIACDVAEEDSLQKAHETLTQSWDTLDILVHSIAFAPRNHLQGRYLQNLNRDGFLTAHEVSSWSFSALAKIFRPHFSAHAALLTLSYIGAERVIPNYNIMGLAKASLEASVRYLAADLGVDGIRVNAISAGPIATLAAMGITGIKEYIAHVNSTNPLKRELTIEDVGNSAMFLCSNQAAAITGEVLHVDCGYHIAGI